MISIWLSLMQWQTSSWHHDFGPEQTNQVFGNIIRGNIIKNPGNTSDTVSALSCLLHLENRGTNWPLLLLSSLTHTIPGTNANIYDKYFKIIKGQLSVVYILIMSRCTWYNFLEKNIFTRPVVSFLFFTLIWTHLSVISVILALNIATFCTFIQYRFYADLPILAEQPTIIIPPLLNQLVWFEGLFSQS